MVFLNIFIIKYLWHRIFDTFMGLRSILQPHKIIIKIEFNDFRKYNLAKEGRGVLYLSIFR